MGNWFQKSALKRIMELDKQFGRGFGLTIFYRDKPFFMPGAHFLVKG